MESFDSEQALQELEKLRAQILEARAERGRIEAAFDAFTSGFGSASPQRSPAVSAPSSRPADAQVHSARPPADPPAPPVANILPVVPAPVHAPVRRRRRNRRVLGVVGAGIGVAIAATFAVRGRQSAPEVAAPTRPSVNPAGTVPPPPAAAVAAPAQSPAPAAAVNVEIVTRRRVWIRVMLDGKRAIEREVPAEQRIPLQAERSIVIRAGDAGAVSVVWNGRDAGALGRDGIAATRQFTSDAK